MPTAKQELGDKGEAIVRKNFDCFKCKRRKTLRPLVRNFKCADLICDFCGYLAQVKTNMVSDIDKLPKTVPSASWEPQKERMDAGIFFPIFFVLISRKKKNKYSVYYLPADLQNESMFKERAPLKSTAKRSGWKGYFLDGDAIGDKAIRLK